MIVEKYHRWNGKFVWLISIYLFTLRISEPPTFYNFYPTSLPCVTLYLYSSLQELNFLFKTARCPFLSPLAKTNYAALSSPFLMPRSPSCGYDSKISAHSFWDMEAVGSIRLRTHSGRSAGLQVAGGT